MSEKLWMRIAWMLPHELVRWCAIRVIAHATTGRFGNTILPGLDAMEAMKRWDEAN